MGSIIGGIGSVLGARSQRKAEERSRSQQLGALDTVDDLRNRLLNELQEGTFRGEFGSADVFGSRPDESSPIDSALAAILGNIENLGPLEQLTRSLNQNISDAAIDRAVSFDPNFAENLSALSESARNLIRGNLPFDDVQDIISDRAELTNAIGVPGTAGNATLRDLGLSRLDAQQRGQNIFQQILAAQQAVDPIQRQITGTQFLVNPQTQLAADTSNAAIRSAADPIASGLFNLDLGGATQTALARAGATVPSTNPLATGLQAVGGAAQAFNNSQLQNAGLQAALPGIQIPQNSFFGIPTPFGI